MKKSSMFTLIVFILILSGCLTIKKTEYFPENGNKNEKNICILYHYTGFRNEVIKRLTEKLKETNISVIVDDAINAKYYKPQEYNIIVVFSGVHAFFPDVFPGLYLEKNKNQKNIIHVFFTFFTPKGVTAKIGIDDKIDTITAASIKVNIDELADKIYELILKKLE